MGAIDLINLFESKYDCSACSACKHICPRSAISMEADEEGFLYPKIDEESCIGCKKCLLVCPIKQPPIPQGKLNPPQIYAIKHKSEDVRSSSTSGGVFTAISDYVLEEDGLVYGAAFDEKMELVHKSASGKKARDELRGSKYIQSNLSDTYGQIISDLGEDKKVLFSGTPCQTAGLINLLKMLKIDYSNLTVVDIVCHGVPSPMVWQDHIKDLEESKDQKLLKYTFRDKSRGWRGYKICVEYEDGELDDKSDKALLYINLYKTNKTIRPCCYRCRFANTKRPSDLTMGDYWGIEKVFRDFDDGRGVSLLYLNTKKGQEIYKKISKDLVAYESSVKKSLQSNLRRPTAETPDRRAFWRDYKKRGYKYAGKKHTKKSILRRIKIKTLLLIKQVKAYR